MLDTFSEMNVGFTRTLSSGTELSLEAPVGETGVAGVSLGDRESTPYRACYRL
jgi:hypothetical protein